MNDNLIGLLNDIVSWQNKKKQGDDSRRDKLKPILVDKSIPLDDRWELFTEAKLGNNSCCIEHFDSLEKGKWDIPGAYGRTNPFHNWILYEGMDKGHKVYLANVAENLAERIGDTLTFQPPKEYDYEARAFKATAPPAITETFTQEDYDAFREEVLEKMLVSFIFDW